MDAGELKELVEQAMEKLAEVRSSAESASSLANDAYRSADYAVDYADSARGEASSAESSADEALGEISNLEEVLEELMEKLEAETGDQVSLAVQLKRYGPKIKELRAKGCSTSDIARRLSISEVIVNIALERQDAA